MATEADKVNTGVLATLVVVSAVSTLGVYLAITALARDQMAKEEAYKEQGIGVPYQRVKGEQLTKLQTGMPIEQAMQKVVADLARDPQSATPGTAPAAGSSPGSAPATSPTPAPQPEGTPSATPPSGATGAVSPDPNAGKQAKASQPAAPSPGAPNAAPRPADAAAAAPPPGAPNAVPRHAGALPGAPSPSQPDHAK